MALCVGWYIQGNGNWLWTSVWVREIETWSGFRGKATAVEADLSVIWVVTFNLWVNSFWAGFWKLR